MRIAIDVMGGDKAPDVILEGAIAALEVIDDNDQLILIGDQTVINETLAEEGLLNDPRFVVEPTTQIIAMDDPPTAAIRDKPDSSIAKMAWITSKKAPDDIRADIALSAGNTGACVAAAQMRMRRLPGVHRPGIAVTMPTFFGPLVVCDVGANIAPRPMHLHQYGQMASIYAKHVHGIDNPRVALMSVGAEEQKGTGIVKETAALMREDKSINYVGFVEGRDLFNDGCDVCITEGFTGNVVLKLAEGLAQGLFRTIVHEIFEADPELAMQFEPIMKSMYKKHDYQEYGGAPLLGANGICIIAHGSSEARTIRAAIRDAKVYADSNVNQAIVDALAQYEALHPTSNIKAD